MSNEELTTQDEKVHARNAKLELRTKMQHHQREWAGLNEQLKVIQKQEELDATLERYKDYKYKIGTYGYKVTAEEKIEEATDGDREVAGRGKSGLVYTGFDGREFGWILMKEKSDYARVARVCQIIDAVEHLADDKIQDKEPYIKIVLGEVEPKAETST
jgi:hypothetical protein